MIWETLWSQLFAWSIYKTWKLTWAKIIFNWYNLLDCSELVTEGNYDDVNWVQIDTYNTPRVDWGWLLGYFINWKTINFKMIINTDSEDSLNSKIDELKQKLGVKDWLLELEINWEYRSQKAYLSWLEFNRDFEKKSIQFNISATFVLLNHLQAEISDYQTELSVVSSPLLFDIDNGWTTSCFYSVYMIFGNWNASINTISLLQNWYTLTINQAITDQDVLVIDWIEKRITLNGNIIDYIWSFQELEVWSNILELQINWTLNVDVTVLFNKNYL